MRNAKCLVVMLTAAMGFVVCSEAAEAKPWRFSVSLGARYTDNRDSVENDEDSTWDLTISPRGSYNIENNATHFQIYYHPSYRYRTSEADNQNDGEFNQSLGVSLDHALSERTELFLEELFQYTDDPDIERGDRTIREDESYILNRVRGQVDHELQKDRLSVRLGANHMVKRYEEDDVADISDEDQAGVELSLLWQANRSTVLRGFGRYTMYGFEEFNGLARDFNTYVVGAGVDRVLSAQMNAKVSVGYQGSDHDDGGINDDSTLYANAELTFEPSPKTLITAAVGHGLRDADVYPYSSQEYMEGRAGITCKATTGITLGLRGLVRQSEYNDQAPSNASRTDFFKMEGDEEMTVTATAEASFKIDETTSISIQQRFEDVDSDVEESFSKNTTSVFLNKSF